MPRSATVAAPPLPPIPGFPSEDDPSVTPAMRQYLRFKRAHPDCVLFFRMGDFYELFWADAELVHRVLGLTLTRRGEGIPMAGVPFHALENYLRRMIRKGHRVAVCDQIQDPKDAKGIVDRAVTRVLTPGTLVDESLLEESRPNQVGALVPGATPGAPATLAYAEVSTGAFAFARIPAAQLRDEFARIGLSELVLDEGADEASLAAAEALASGLGLATVRRPGWSFRAADAADALRRQFRVATLEGFGLHDDPDAVRACGALLRYLLDTQAPSAAGDRTLLAHLEPPRRASHEQHLVVDQTSLRSLEIERTMRSGETEGSVLWALSGCATPMGRRMLRQWLCFPLRDRAAIEARQDAVGAFVGDEDLAHRLRVAIEPIQDLARITGRLATGRATPRDLVALGRGAARAALLRDVLAHDTDALDGPRARLAALHDALVPLGRRIGDACVDDAPPHLREGGLVRDGVDAALDEARTLQRDGASWLAAYQERLVGETGIASLKVGYNKVFGYYIEVTHANAAKVPPAFARRQTLRNAERYVTEELKTYEEKVLRAESDAVAREQAIFAELCGAALDAAGALVRYAELVAELDVLLAFADHARRRGHCRPRLVDEPAIEIVGGRHPVLDRILGERFVPNDCRLDAAAPLALITGPNMAGKSTYIRQVALLALLAHVGSWLPAESATIGLADRIFTRIGASDELHAGQSTFMVEMTETAAILHHATDRSIVVLDEIGRGTSTLDGLALAWAIAETVADARCRALFATHYHELTALADQRTDVTNLHVLVREWGDEVVFLHRIEPGRTDRSYGIHVARIAGLPKRTVERARTVLESLAVHHAEVPPEPSARARRVRPPAPQLELFVAASAEPHPVVTRLREVAIERTTPMEAFDLLRELVRDAAE